MFQLYNFTFKDVCPSVNDILEFLQTPALEDSHPLMLSINNILLSLENYNEIKGGYTIVDCIDVKVKEGDIVFADETIHAGKQISAYMKGAEQIVLAFCTAGEIFTTMSHAYQEENDLLEAFIVDAIGSLTVENAADKVQAALEEEMAGKDIASTNRYSPGYCHWPLISQKAIFRMAGDNPTGIGLTESCLMQPIKSVSAIIGIGKDVKKKPYGCSICDSATCVYKNIKNRKA